MILESELRFNHNGEMFKAASFWILPELTCIVIREGIRFLVTSIILIFLQHPGLLLAGEVSAKFEKKLRAMFITPNGRYTLGNFVSALPLLMSTSFCIFYCSG